MQSAFNGLAVYRVAALRAANATGCRFAGSKLSRNCEHVPFTSCLRARGLAIGVLPPLVANCGAPPLRGPFERAKVRATLFANNSVQLLEMRHRMPLYAPSKSAPTGGAKPPPFERWAVAGGDST